MAYYATNNGMTVIACDSDYIVNAGEVLFEDFPTAEQLTVAFTGYTAAVIAANLAPKITAALAKSDMVAMRCLKAGVPFPPEWQTYVTALRSGMLPNQPAYPSNT